MLPSRSLWYWQNHAERWWLESVSPPASNRPTLPILELILLTYHWSDLQSKRPKQYHIDWRSRRLQHRPDQKILKIYLFKKIIIVIIMQQTNYQPTVWLCPISTKPNRIYFEFAIVQALATNLLRTNSLRLPFPTDRPTAWNRLDHQLVRSPK